jgi:hypothetical protein
VVSGAELKNSTAPFLLWMSYKATKGSTVLTPDIDGDQTALDLLPVTSAVPHSHIGKMCLACRNIGNASATSSGIKSGMYVLVTTPTIACVIFTKPVTAAIHTYIPLTLYPQRGSRGISNIPPRLY